MDLIEKLFSDERLETFPINIWYLLLAVIISSIFIFLLNFALTNEMINCDCQPWNLDPIINRDAEMCYVCDKNVSKVRNNNSALVKLSFLSNGKFS